MQEKRLYNKIPIALKESEFNEFVLPHLKKGSRGPRKKLSFFKIFNYILKFMGIGDSSSLMKIAFLMCKIRFRTHIIIM